MSALKRIVPAPASESMMFEVILRISVSPKISEVLLCSAPTTIDGPPGGSSAAVGSPWEAKPGPARIRFGAPLRLQGDDYAALAKQVEDAVRLLVQ